MISCNCRILTKLKLMAIQKRLQQYLPLLKLFWTFSTCVFEAVDFDCCWSSVNSSVRSVPPSSDTTSLLSNLLVETFVKSSEPEPSSRFLSSTKHSFHFSCVWKGCIKFYFSAVFHRILIMIFSVVFCNVLREMRRSKYQNGWFCSSQE